MKTTMAGLNIVITGRDGQQREGGGGGGDTNARSTQDPMYDEGCPHRIADKSNCDLRPE